MDVMAFITLAKHDYGGINTLNVLPTNDNSINNGSFFLSKKINSI